jgi:hypothetical protein
MRPQTLSFHQLDSICYRRRTTNVMTCLVMMSSAFITVHSSELMDNLCRQPSVDIKVNGLQRQLKRVLG